MTSGTYRQPFQENDNCLLVFDYIFPGTVYILLKTVVIVTLQKYQAVTTKKDVNQNQEKTVKRDKGTNGTRDIWRD